MKVVEQEQVVRVFAAGVVLEGNLVVPAGAHGIVIFAHGSGSSRHSPRNRYVADYLQHQRLGTLLIDLLTPNEEQIDLRTRHLRFDIDLLADRLAGAAEWVSGNPDTQGLTIGYFGASTGAASALVAAAQKSQKIGAIVSRGGRPDLAGSSLAHVKAPTLLIVGGADEPVIGLNEDAFRQLRVEKRMEIIPGATHLFEEPGALEQVAKLAGDWFARTLG